MTNRDEFDLILREILGSSHTYFQPPESVKMHYPCFVYEFSRDDKKHANDHAYLVRQGYDVTYISKDPDVTMKEELDERFIFCEWQRSFVADNLNHNLYKIYF